MSKALIAVSDIWEEVNQRNIKFIEKLANKHEIEYNSNTDTLVVNEEEKTINVERRDN